jgi:hypothetical protein
MFGDISRRDSASSKSSSSDDEEIGKLLRQRQAMKSRGTIVEAAESDEEDSFEYK